MNIFELAAKDSLANANINAAFAVSQTVWKHFKDVMNQFLCVPNLPAALNLQKKWEDIQHNSPQITDMVSSYSAFRIKEYISSELRQQIRRNSNFEARIKILSGFIEPTIMFLRALSKKNLVLQVEEQTKSILTEFAMKDTFVSIFTHSFNRFCHSILRQDMVDMQDKMREFVEPKGSYTQQALETNELKFLLDTLVDLNVVQWMLEPAFDALNQDLQKFIENYIDHTDNKQFHKQCLNYERTFQRKFLRSLESNKNEQFLKTYIASMDDNAYFLCAKLCSNFILDIILDYPDSLPTIFSLKECVDKSHLLNEISEKLVKDVKKRLLIPGVLTQSILNQYINMLKVLQTIDPHGFIFDLITQPIKQYLMKRNDTLRCIISFMTEDVENYSKLTKQVVKITSKEYIEDIWSDEDDNVDMNWEILANKESKTKIRVKYQESDMATVLVNLYGSQEAFINEYQNILAEKLMSAKDYNLEQEIKNIELLKIRFGQNALQNCNVIVKDVKDSKKLDKEIHGIPQISNLNRSLVLQKLNCLTVSKGYWPINYEAPNLTVPKIFQQVFNVYAEKYSRQKEMRKIYFHYNLGLVNLTLSFNNGEFDFKCLPIHAMMISCFDEDNVRGRNMDSMGVSSEDLGRELGLSSNAVKQKMSFWVHKGVIKENKIMKQGLSLKRVNSFEDSEVVYYRPVEDYQQVASDEIDDDIDYLIIKESTSTESHLKHIIEGLIISILSINGPKPPEKIHLLLKTIYKTDLNYTYGEAQTQEILKKMIQKKKIHFNGENYFLKADS